MSTANACYRRTAQDGDDELFDPTSLAIGPWDDRLQHAGPAAALLVRAMDRLETSVDGRICRLVVEILRPILMTEMRVRAEVIRNGRKIALLGAQMLQRGADGTDQVVATAQAWRLATSDTTAARHVPDEVLSPVSEAELADGRRALPAILDRGFVGGLDWVVRAEFGQRGTPTPAWARPRFDLVEGEPITALEQVVMIADSVNGVGMRVDPLQWSFMNTDLTLHLHTPPRGDWVGLVAETTIGPDGVGTSAAILHDQHGPVGRVAQTLLVEAR